MKVELLKPTKIGAHLQVGAEYEKSARGLEIGLYLASADVSASCAFLPEEWDNFCSCINRIDRKLKESIAS